MKRRVHSEEAYREPGKVKAGCGQGMEDGLGACFGEGCRLSQGRGKR
ncbi:hypothetical protein [Eubacterium callanderi]|uniref:Uncharacterized protein n=1 Tax=Eubacterium callanderi TaxID=53442 RepID=E3GR65_9FIRM|nr:hypothetical protein ELI_4573 [Eubacterium callanderi]